MGSNKAITNIEKLLCRVYGINHIKAVFPIGKGEWNSINKIEAAPNLVLRISHKRKKETQLAFELDVMTHAAKSLSVVPKIQLTNNDDLYHDQNGVFYTLFEFKEGKPISVNLESVKRAGKLLGRIHRVLREYSEKQRYLNGFSIIDFDWEDNYFF